MSQQLINHSDDLSQLVEDGYHLDIKSEKYLLVKNVPYVNSDKEVKYGTLVSELALAGEVTIQPNTHVTYFIGEHPCDANGTELEQIRHGGQATLTDELTADHSFSAAPKQPETTYRDYHHKMVTYMTLISNFAQEINPSVTPRIYPEAEYSEDRSVFKYPDTASSRAGIDVINSKIILGKVAIVGVGGTGSYVLDLISKTPVEEIHIFDGDEYLNHNAFRSPGAPSGEDLRARPLKVDYFKDQYSKMRWKIFAHNHYVNAETINDLSEMDFVFLCLDKGANKKVIVDQLKEWGKPFIDVGVGVNLVDESLMGTVRTTLVTESYNDHTDERIPFSDANVNNDYSKNIQIAELNALNAALAVIKWKKLFGYYQDTEYEHNSFYSIAGNILINEDKDDVEKNN